MNEICDVSGIVPPERPSVIEETAVKELQAFLLEFIGKHVALLSEPTEHAILLGTPGSSNFIAERSHFGRQISVWSIDTLKDDGFIISNTTYRDKKMLVIAARMPRGVLYGAFTLMEKIKLGINNIFELDFKDEPWYDFRNIWIWDKVGEGFLKFENLKEPKKSIKLKKFVRMLASLRVNSLTLGASEISRGIDPVKHLAEYDSFSRFLQEYGIDLYLQVFYSPPKSWVETHERPFCPYNPAFQQYWKELTDKLFNSITGLKGFVLKGTGYENVPGPLSCRCAKCLSKSSSERILKALQVIAEPLKKYEGKLIYRTWTTGAEQDVEFRLFKPVVRRKEFPENVYIATKKGYGDFLLREFPHPLIGYISPHTSHIVELQIWGEYRGSHYFPCSMTERWGEWFRHTREKIDGLIGIVKIHPQFYEHPLNMVNWYSFGRLAWNPAVSSEVILEDWAKLNYGKAYKSIVKILKMMTQACEKMMYMKGIWTQSHSYLPRLRYLDTHMCGRWSGLPRIPNKIGWGKPLYLYPSAQEETYSKDPNMLLFYSRVKISEELKKEALREKEEAIVLIEAAIEELNKIEPLLEPKVYGDLLRRFTMNLNDAKIWRDCIDLYFDYKLGKLTLNAVEEIWNKHKDSKGSPLTEAFKEFIDDLRSALKNGESLE